MCDKYPVTSQILGLSGVGVVIDIFIDRIKSLADDIITEYKKIKVYWFCRKIVFNMLEFELERIS